MTCLDIKGIAGTPMRVLLIRTGEKSPHSPTVAKEDLVEFYDYRYNGPRFTPDGQLITTYYTSTLTRNAGTPTGGLDLYGSEPSWKINGQTFKLVLDWIAYHQYKQP